MGATDSPWCARSSCIVSGEGGRGEEDLFCRNRTSLVCAPSVYHTSICSDIFVRAARCITCDLAPGCPCLTLRQQRTGKGGDFELGAHAKGRETQTAEGRASRRGFTLSLD